MDSVTITFLIIVTLFFVIPNTIQVYLQQKNIRVKLPKHVKEITRQRIAVEETLPEILNLPFDAKPNEDMQQK